MYKCKQQIESASVGINKTDILLWILHPTLKKYFVDFSLQIMNRKIVKIKINVIKYKTAIYN